MTNSPEDYEQALARATRPDENPEKSLREWDAFFARWGQGAASAENPPQDEQKLTKGVLTQEDF